MALDTFNGNKSAKNENKPSSKEEVNKVNKGKEVIHLTDTLDPKQANGSKLNAFDTDFKSKMSSGLNKLFSPLNNLNKRLGGKGLAATGGLFVSKAGADGKTKSISESLTDFVMDSTFNKMNLENIVTRLDNEIIGKKFPGMEGLLSGELTKHSVPARPNENGDYWYDTNQERAINDIGRGNLSGIAAYAQDMNLADPKNFYFGGSGGVNTLGNKDIKFMLLNDTNQFGHGFYHGTMSNMILNEAGMSVGSMGANGILPDKLPADMENGGSFTEELITRLIANYGMKNKTFARAVEAAQVAGNLWDEEFSNAPEAQWWNAANMLVGAIDNDTLSSLAGIANMAAPLTNETTRNEMLHQYWNYGNGILQDAKVFGTRFIDGAGDFIKESWDDISEKARNTVDEYYNYANDLLDTFGIQLNPDLKKNIDGVLGKMGFTKTKGEGYDWEGYPSDAILLSNIVFINGIQFPAECFMGFFEDHDYISNKFPVRKLRVMVPTYFKLNYDAELNPANLNKENPYYSVVLSRQYGFTRSQNYRHFSLVGDAVFRSAETLIGYNGVPTISKWVKENVDMDKLAKDVENGLNEAMDYDEILELTLTSRADHLLEGPPKAFFQGIVKDDKTTIATVIQKAFDLHFYGEEQNEDMEKTKKPMNTHTGTLTMQSDVNGGVSNGTMFSEGLSSANVGKALVGDAAKTRGEIGSSNAYKPKGDEYIPGVTTETGLGGQHFSNSSDVDNMEFKLALTKPEIETDFRTVQTPKSFPDVVAYYQKESGDKLFNGGYNIFMDGPDVYVLNKKGPNHINFEKDWEVEFRFLPRVTLYDMHYTLFSISERKIVIGMWYNDIMKMGTFDLYNEMKNVTIQQGSTVAMPTTVKEGDVGKVKYSDSHNDAVITDPTEIKKCEEFIIRIPNTYIVFRPGDNIKIKLGDGTKMNGTVKKWAAEQNKAMRIVIIYVVLVDGEGDPLDSGSGDDKDIANNPINKGIKEIQQKTTMWSDKYSAAMDKLQSKYQDAQKKYDKLYNPDDFVFNDKGQSITKGWEDNDIREQTYGGFTLSGLLTNNHIEDILPARSGSVKPTESSRTMANLLVPGIDDVE